VESGRLTYRRAIGVNLECDEFLEFLTEPFGDLSLDPPINRLFFGVLE
jgi:hypothetical protein